MNKNDISYGIRGAAFKINSTLGPGLLESVYHAAMAYELTKTGFQICTEVGVPVIYDEQDLGLGFRLGIIVNESVIVEIKSVGAFAPVHYKQLRTYLILSKKKLGLMINFNSDSLTNSIKRIANGM